jgi:hypothetical protein
MSTASPRVPSQERPNAIILSLDESWMKIQILPHHSFPATSLSIEEWAKMDYSDRALSIFYILMLLRTFIM